MLWLKAFHIIFVVTWFAGLFYLPRLFIYHTEASDETSLARFKIMERRLLMITHIGALLAVIFGMVLLGWWTSHVPGYLPHNHWMHVKLLLVAVLIGYHLMLMRMTAQFRDGTAHYSSRWLRIFNEIPSFLLIAIVILVVVKPF